MNRKKTKILNSLFAFALAIMMMLATFSGFIEIKAEDSSEDPSLNQVWRVITEDREEKEFPKKDDSVEWTTSDFEITNGKVVGFSSQGYEKFNSNPANVVVKIPAKDKDNMPVTIIGNDAFRYNSSKFKHEMQFIEFPDTLTNIEECAFYGQDLHFEEFTVPNTWKEVNENAFYGAYFKKLILTNMNQEGKNIYWQGVTTPYIEMNGMGEYTVNSGFFSSTNTKHINYGNSEIKLNSKMFYYVNNHKRNNNEVYKTFRVTWNGQKTQADFELPPWENTIYDSVFENCQGLQSVYISNHKELKSIRKRNFLDCKDLIELIIYNNPKLEDISGEYVIRSCPALKRVIFEKLPSFRYFGYYGLVYNKSLQEVIFKDLPSFEYIQHYSLYGNENLKNLNFKNLPAFKYISNNTLGANKSLTSITFENLPNFEFISSNSAYNNDNLQSVVFIDIPNFNYIGKGSFSENPNLKTVTFKDAYIKSFGENAFSDSDIDTLIFDESEEKLDRPLEFQRGAFRNNKIIELNLPDRYIKDSGASFTNQKFTKVLDSENFKDDPNYKYVDNGSEKYVIITNPIKLTHGTDQASLGTFDTNPYVELLPGPNGEPGMLLKIKGNTKLGETFNATWSNNKLTIPDVRGSEGFIPFTGSVNFSIAFDDLGEVNIMKDNWKYNPIKPIEHLRTTPISNDTITKAVVTASDSTVKDKDIDKKVVFSTIDTFKPAGTKQDAVVRVYFKDGTFKDVKVPTILTQTAADKFREDIVNGTLKPELEIVRQYGAYDLTDNFGELPEGVTIEETSTKINTAILGDHEAKVTINIPNGEPLKNVKVTVRVIPLDADAKDIKVKTIVKTQGTGDKIDLTEGIEGYENLGVEKVETLITVDDKEIGNYNGKLKLTFKDGSTQFLYIPVQIVPVQEEFSAKTQKVQVYKDHVVTNGDLRDCFLNLPPNAEVIDLTQPPVDTSKIGEKAAKVKVILKDGREYEQALIIEVIDPIGELEKQIESDNEKIKTITENNEKLAKEIEKLQNQINELVIKLNQAEVDKIELNNQINTLTSEKEKLEIIIKNNEELIKELKNHIETLKAQILDLQNQIKVKDELINKLLEKIGTLETKVETVTKENTELKEKLATATEKISNLEEKIKELKDKVSDLEKEVEDEKDKNDKLKQELEDTKKALEEEKDKLAEKTKELEEEMDKAKSEKDKLTEEKEALEKEVEDLKKQLEEQTSDSTNTIKELKKKIVKLEKLIESKDNEINTLVKEITELKDKLKESTNNLTNTEVKIIELTTRIKELEKQLSDNEDKYNREREEWIRDRYFYRDRYIQEQRQLSYAHDKENRDLKDNNKDLKNRNKVLEERIAELNRNRNNYGYFRDDYVTIFSLDSQLYKTYSSNEFLTQAEMTDSKGYLKPFISNNRTMLPIRYLALSLGMDVDWNSKTRTATFSNYKGNNALSRGKVTINADTLEMKDQTGKLINVDAKPVLINGRFYVSITNVTRAFGGSNGSVNDGIKNTIEWSPINRQVLVYKNVR